MVYAETPYDDGSRQRIQDHGEVFTPPELVGQMLDLVASECEREDSRFLEPACGNGNFLAEVLRRRLDKISRRHRSQSQWEVHALLGLACLYGIELLPDNVSACRERLLNLFWGRYVSLFESKAKPDVKTAAHVIVHTNIILGDALSMRTKDDPARPEGQPIVMTEWATIGRGFLKRCLYEYRDLTPPAPGGGSLFDSPRTEVPDEDGKPLFFPSRIQDLPLIHYLKLGGEVDS